MSHLKNNYICRNCSTWCCKKSTPFLTKKEKQKYSIEFKDKCKHLINNKCLIYKKRPIDCKIFPIQILKVNGKFFWVLIKNKDCPLSQKIDLKNEIKYIEKNYLLKIKDELEDYHKQPWNEWFNNYEIIQEINLK